PISMLIPEVVGFRLTNRLPEGATATDLVLTITERLRKLGVVGKFVEFFGPGLEYLTIADRATLGNMSPEYGATIAICPIDEMTLDYLRLTARDEAQVALVEASATAVAAKTETIPGMEGLDHGSVVVAAITSCTNTSNPSVMIGAGLLARNALRRGLTTKPWVKPSLAPGSLVVTEYLRAAGLLEPLAELGFNLVGYGCTTCIGNSGPLPEPVSSIVREKNLVVASVLSGNRNFEGRIQSQVRANYLASPPLVVAYALAGRMQIDLTCDPLGTGSDGEPVHLRDIWPSEREIQQTMLSSVRRD